MAPTDGLVVKTDFIIYEVYHVELDIKIVATHTEDWKTVFYIGSGTGMSPGHRHPAVFTYKNSIGLYNRFHLDESTNYILNLPLAALDTWYHMIYRQYISSTDGLYYLEVTLDGVQMMLEINDAPIQVSDASIWVAPYSSSPVLIQNFKYTTADRKSFIYYDKNLCSLKLKLLKLKNIARVKTHYFK